MNIIYKKYNRKTVENDPNTMYIFGDNLDRSSGNNKIPEDSWYTEQFGKHCYPKITTACIRGLDNAYPITTMKTYDKDMDYRLNRWEDYDIRLFEKVIDSDFERIKNNLSKYNNIVLPEKGIFDTKISNISEKRCKKIYKYLSLKLNELELYIMTLEPKLWS